jgi:hypothetical protein
MLEGCYQENLVLSLSCASCLRTSTLALEGLSCLTGVCEGVCLDVKRYGVMCDLLLRGYDQQLIQRERG